MTTLAALTDWLDRYEQAWRNNDPDQIRDLFTEDAVYRWHPWEDGGDAAEGAEDIVQAWLEQPDDPDDWTLECEPVAVNGEVGVARCVTRYRATARGPARVYHNIWVLSLDDDGRCSDYTEYYMKEPTEETA
ncbi:MAG TPA: nuclear transport factor 2 family protein [Candidatus Limnocylindria bacterium]|jgi:ketosteroid isomerase-like protein